MAADAKTLELIRRLLALGQSSNVHEAAAAMKKAQELLFKYNLEIQDIPGEQRDDYAENRYTVGEGRVTSWARELLFPIATYNFCRAFYEHSIDSRGRLHRVPYMTIVGEPHNIEIVKYVHGFCRDEIIRLSEREWLTQGRGNKATWKKDFCFGAVQGVRNQLYQQWLQSQQVSEKGTALVHVKTEDLERAIGKLIGVTRPMNLNPGDFGRDAYVHGKTKGENMEINKGLEEGEESDVILLG